METDPATAASAPAGRGGSWLLLVDDDDAFSFVLARALRRRGFVVEIAQDIAAAAALLAGGWQPPAYAIIDLNLGAESGLRLIAPVRSAAPSCRILVLTGYASIATAVDAIKLGADEYLAKPTDADTIARSLRGDRAPDPDFIPGESLSVPRVEWEHIQRVLADHGGNVSATARALRMHRRTLQRKLSKRPVRE